MLETKYVGEDFEMLMTDSRCSWPIEYIENNHLHSDFVTNIFNLSPESLPQHVFTNITVPGGFITAEF